MPTAKSKKPQAKAKPAAAKASPAVTEATFVAIRSILERCTLDINQVQSTPTHYEIRTSTTSDDWQYMIPFARLEANRGVKLTFFPPLTEPKIRAQAKASKHLAAHALTNGKSWVFADGISAQALAELEAVVLAAHAIWPTGRPR
jgi:hypothetical protein